MVDRTELDLLTRVYIKYFHYFTFLNPHKYADEQKLELSAVYDIFAHLKNKGMMKVKGKPLFGITEKGIRCVEKNSAENPEIIRLKKNRMRILLLILRYEKTKEQKGIRYYTLVAQANIPETELQAALLYLTEIGLLYNPIHGDIGLTAEGKDYLKKLYNRKKSVLRAKKQMATNLPPLDKKTLKLGILRAILAKTNIKDHKSNLLGRPYDAPGGLEFQLRRTFTREERGLASLALQELIDAARVMPTFEDNAHNWVTITDFGRTAETTEYFEEDDGKKLNPLTHLPSLEQFEEDFRFYANKRQLFSLAFIDMDNLKSLNESVGHDNADAVIKEFAQILKQSISTISGTLYHRSGDEFLALFPGLNSADASNCLERSMETIKRHEFVAAPSKTVTFSAGVSDSELVSHVNELPGNANQSMFAAKKLGKGRIELGR